MTVFGDLRAGLSPAVEELLEEFDSSSTAPLRGRERRVEYLLAGLFLAVTGAMVALIPDQRELSIPLAAVLVVAYAMASRIRFAVGWGYTTPTQLVFVPMLFLLPCAAVPLFVAAGMALSMLPDYLAGKRHPSRLALPLNDSWYAVGPALVLSSVSAPELGAWPLLLAALAAQLVFDVTAATARDVLGLGISAKLQPGLFGWEALVDVMLSPVGLLTAMVAQDDPWNVLLVLPLCGVLALFSLERKARLAQSIELSRAYRGTTLLLGDVLEADDEYTGIHSHGVVSLSVAVADELGLTSRERRNIEFGALLHDVGKIAVPKEIINKPGPLTPDEWLVIKAHTIEGQKMLDRVGGLLSDVGRIVRSSHESWDGSGYPDGLAGDEIPLGSTIVSCCDAFNAMTTDRSYRSAMSLEEALAELRNQSGKQFNPAVVDVLTRIVERSSPVGPGGEPERVGISAVSVPAAG
jgi:HD-GYP domain-containing protein (c-di-GMP phosphodiesterase class II)